MSRKSDFSREHDVYIQCEAGLFGLSNLLDTDLALKNTIDNAYIIIALVCFHYSRSPIGVTAKCARTLDDGSGIEGVGLDLPES